MISDNFVEAFRIASQVKDPIAALVCMALIAAVLLGVLWNKWPLVAVGVAVLFLAVGSFPLVATTILKLQDVYHVQIVVLGVDGHPMGDAEINAPLGVAKKEPLSWELEIASQVLPSDRELTIYASVKDSYIAGKSTIKLGSDYFPRMSIQLKRLPSVVLRGVVLLPDGSSAVGAHVSVPGYTDEAVTDAMGNFSLQSHVADGQTVTVRAEMGGLEAQYTLPAVNPLTLMLRQR